MLNQIDETGWKRVCRVADRFVQQNRVAGDDSIREYLEGDDVVARMVVQGANTDSPAIENGREFFATAELIEETAGVVILSDQDWDEWDELEEGEDEDWLKAKGVEL